MAWHPAEADMGAFVTQCLEEVHAIADEKVFSISITCKQDNGSE